ncbi:MAG TPA: FAD-binding oxidoreductase [Candidatus Paceibacterota bacterium]|nr:FAD-binding oxidoreductase [Candidatus Paceibacterota bacterium]
MSLQADLASLIKGEIADDVATLRTFSRDTSIFERQPSIVVFPKDASDVAAVVQYVHAARMRGEHVAIAARSAGTDMSGGPLTDSIVLSFTKHMNRVYDVGSDYVVAEPGVFYRDLEAQTLEKAHALIPSFPASRDICALGGMIANNSGGELTLHYGKTDRYVEELDVVLSDGSAAVFRPLSQSELAQKESEQTLEGSIYRAVHDLILEHEDVIEAARPKVSKNSAGYALWDVIDEKKGTFDLTKLVVGSQGTLCLVTKARMKTVRLKEHRAMVVAFLTDIALLPEIVNRIMKHDPESFESYDDQTFRLAVKFMPQIIGHFGFLETIRLGLAFIPELWMVVTGGVPKLVLMAEFAEDSPEAARDKVREIRHDLGDLPVKTRLAFGEMEKKYWTIRHESFALLRKNLKGLYASPFIDDFVVPPSTYAEFLPALYELLGKYDLIYTIAGHVGNGNFHIIPLVNLNDERARNMILELTPKVYDLVFAYGGSSTGEHNDGIIRTPYLEQMFGMKMVQLFAEVKRIFDPQNIFNPGKKVGGTFADIEKYMIKKH